MNKTLNAYYKEQILKLKENITSLKAKNTSYIICEITTFIGIIAFIVLYILYTNSLWNLLGSGICLALYILTRYYDGKNSENIENLTSLKKTYQQEVDYFNGDFSCFDQGNKYIDANHPFTLNIDIFGYQSLFQRINRCITTTGADYLAACLAEENTESNKISKIKQIKQRTLSIKTLSADEPLITQFKAIGASKTIDTNAIKMMLEKISQINVPRLFSFTPFTWLRRISLVGFYLAILCSFMGYCSFSTPITWAVTNFCVSFFASYRYIKLVNNALQGILNYTNSYLRIIRLIENVNTDKAEELKQIKTHLIGALKAFECIQRLLQKIDGRSNEFGVVLLNTLKLTDLSILCSFANLQANIKLNTESWINDVSTFDALISMANFRLNEDKATDANIVQSKEVVFKADNIYHPFLGENAVKNNFYIEPLSYYIITGANMAGKSTFLRTIGINYILAMNGLPVFADSLTVSIFHLFTSMRTTDDLAKGISYFNAELLRLKLLISSLQPTMPNLIILDEILKGTNSLDKLNGSRLFLEYVAKRNVTGIIATHDLELSKMETDKRFHNYCFEIELGNNITYSYKITKGVARNQNATYLLKDILKG